MAVLELFSNSKLRENALDWGLIESKISSQLYFTESKIFFTKNLFHSTKEKAQCHLDSISKYIDDWDAYEPTKSSALSAIPHIDDSNATLKRLEKSHTLEWEQIHFLLRNLESFLDLQKIFINLLIFDQYSIPPEERKSLSQKTIKRIRPFLDEEGNFLAHKHPETSKLIDRINKLDGEIKQSCDKLLKSESLSSVLQYQEPDRMNGHVVIPLRSDSYRKDFGSIISHSNSGRTLYIEPASIKKLNQERMQAEAELEWVFEKIRREYTEILAQSLSSCRSAVFSMKEFDCFYAKAKFCYDMGYVKPSLCSSANEINLLRFRHPLIEDPVPNDFYLNVKGNAASGLLISGPNTGGKTVYLKTVAICLLFARAGIFVPASEATLPFVAECLFLSHDHQDIDQGLSSFGAEVENYLDTIAMVNKSSFVFIDEIFNSTSSDEASALAIGFFDKLIEKGCHFVATTHHQLLKNLCASNRSIISCHVGFDEESLGPTYKVIMGTSGSSHAIDIFKIKSNGIGFANSIIEKAERILSQKHVEYEKLLTEVSKKNAKLDKILRESEEIRKQLQNEKEAANGLAFLESQKIIAQKKEALSKIITQGEQFLHQLKEEKKAGAKTFFRQTSELSTQIEQLEPESQHSNNKIVIQRDHLNFDSIKPGQLVFSLSLNKELLVDRVDYNKKKVLLGKGAFKKWESAENIRSAQKNYTREVKVSVAPKSADESLMIIDCRGMRGSDFEKIVEDHLDRLRLGEVPFLEFVHGHGTGVLKSLLRDRLKKDSDFTWETHEGNDGSTIVKIS